MPNWSRRRSFLAGVGTIVVTGGCLSQLRDDGDDGNTSSEDPPDDPQNDAENGNDPPDDEPAPEPNPIYPAIEYGESVTEFDPDVWSHSEGATLSLDEETTVSGQGSFRIERAGVDRATLGYTFPIPLDLQGRHLSMAVKVDSPAGGRIETRLRAPTNDDRVVCTRRLPPDMTDWFRIDFGITQGQGDPNLSNIHQIRIEARGREETDIRFWVDDIRATEGVGESFAILVFYGALESHYEHALPALEARGWTGAVTASSATLGSSGRMNLEQLDEFQDAGWDICSLPWSGRPLQEMDADDQRRVIEHEQSYFEHHGFPDGARHFFAPRDRINGDTLEILRDVHATGFIYGGNSSGMPPTGLQTIPYLIGSDYDGSRSAVLRADIHDQLVVLVFEEIGEDGMDLETFEAQLDRIENNNYGGGFNVITPSTLVDSYLS